MRGAGRDPAADCDVALLPDLPAKRGTDAFGGALSPVRVRFRQKQSELLPAVTRHKISVSCALLQHGRHTAQDRIARRMSEGVIERLEMICVEQHEGEGVLITYALFKEKRQLLLKRPMVAKPGQSVGDGLRGELLIESFQSKIGLFQFGLLDFQGADLPLAEGRLFY